MGLNDLGITLEIIGFTIFLFIPLRETWYLLLSSAPKPGRIKKALDRKWVRALGVFLIIVGLIMQYEFLNDFLIFKFYT